MLVVFANNQTLIAASGTTVTITTDPVALGDDNQATGVTNIHAMFNDHVRVGGMRKFADPLESS